MQNCFSTNGSKYLASIAVKLNFIEKKILETPKMDMKILLNFFNTLHDNCGQVEKEIDKIENYLKTQTIKENKNGL